MKKIKLISTLLFFILIFGSISISFAGSGGGGGCSINKHYDGDKVWYENKVYNREDLPSNIYDPLGNIIYTHNNYFTPEILTLTNVPNFYTDPESILTEYNSQIISKFNYETGADIANSLKFNCLIGGQYKIDGVYITTEYHVDGCDAYYIVQKIPEDLFYCKTTKDLFNQIQIPKTWENDEIIVYCNEGLNSNFKMLNIDFLTTKLDTYNSCIIKNLDLKSKNTIIYGFEKGNQIMDYDVDVVPVIDQIFASYEISNKISSSDFPINDDEVFTISKTKFEIELSQIVTDLTN